MSPVGKADGILTGLIADHLLTDPAEVEALKAKGFKQYGRDPYLGGILYKILVEMVIRKVLMDVLMEMMRITC